MIIKWIKDKHGITGVIIAKLVDSEYAIGWSKVHPIDRTKKFDKVRALSIAIGRANKRVPIYNYHPTSISHNMPKSFVVNHLEPFVERCQRYFHTQNVPVNTG